MRPNPTPVHAPDGAFGGDRPEPAAIKACTSD